MKVFNFNRITLESWWSLLKDLNNDIKIEMVERLTNSLKKTSPPKKSGEEEWMKLYGSWAKENESAEEIIFKIKESRISNRKIEPLD